MTPKPRPHDYNELKGHVRFTGVLATIIREYVETFPEEAKIFFADNAGDLRYGRFQILLELFALESLSKRDDRAETLYKARLLQYGITEDARRD